MVKLQNLPEITCEISKCVRNMFNIMIICFESNMDNRKCENKATLLS